MPRSILLHHTHHLVGIEDIVSGKYRSYRKPVQEVKHVV
jgi:hypothetical protein